METCLPNREQCPRRVQNDTSREAVRSTHPYGWGVPTIPIRQISSGRHNEITIPERRAQTNQKTENFTK